MSYTNHVGYGSTGEILVTGTMTLGLKKTETLYGAVWSLERDCNSVGYISHAGKGFTAETYRAVTTPGGVNTYTYGIRITTTDLVSHDFPLYRYTTTDTRSLDLSLGLTYEIRFAARLLYNWDLASGSTILGTTMPLYQGNEALKVEWSHYGAWSITITTDDTPVSGSATWSDSGTISTSSPISASALSFGGTGQDKITATAAANSTTGGSGVLAAVSYLTTANVTWNYKTAALLSSHSYSSSTARGPISRAYTANSVTATAEFTTVSGGTFLFCEAAVEVAPVRTVNLIADVFGFGTGALIESASPADPTVIVGVRGGATYYTLTTTDGHLVQTFTQRFERATSFSGTETLDSTADYGAIAAYIPASWMTGARGYLGTSTGTDGSYGSDFHFKAQRHNSVLSIDIAADSTLPSGTDTTVSGGVRRTWTNKEPLTSYRYLSVAVGGDLDDPGSIRIVRSIGDAPSRTTSYEWYEDRDGMPLAGPGPFVIDLLCPGNRTVDIDATASTYPEDTGGSAGIRRGEGQLTGPSWVSALEVIGTSSGSTPSFGDIKRVRQSADPKTLLSCMDQTGAWRASQLSGTNVYKRAFLSLTVDGRVEAISEPDSQCTQTGSSVAPRSYDIVEMQAQLTHARNAGVSATTTLSAASGAPPAWLSDQLPSVGLAGAGLLWDAVAQEWESTLDTAFTESTGSTLTLDYQLGVRSIVFPADAGDIFGHAGTATTSGATTIVAYSMIHSQVCGVVLADPGVPEDPVAVAVKLNSTWSGTLPYPDERGEGDSGDMGFFGTGTDWMRGYLVLHDVYSDGQTTTLLAAPRRRFPVRVVGASSKGLASLASPDGWYAVAMVETDSGTTGIRFRRCDHGVPDPATGTVWPVLVFATTDTADKWPSLAQDPWGKLWLLYERGGSIYERFSDDEGASWSEEAMAFSEGKFPDQDSDPMTGTLLRAAVVAASSGGGYVIKGQVQHPGDASPSAEFTFQYHDGSALADLKVKRSAFRLACGYEVQGRWNLSLIYEGESEISHWWCADGEGRTWTRIV